MKTRQNASLPVLLAALLFMIGASVKPANAQNTWTPGEYMKTSMLSVLKLAHYFETESRFGFMDGVCLMGAYIREGKQVGWTANFEAGTQYVIIGAGGNDSRDLDLKVFNSSNTLVVEDVKTDNTPVVTFTPSRSGRYTIYLKLYDCTTQSDFCGMTILKKYGNSLPSTNMSEALTRLLSLGRAVNSQTGVKFHDYENQWCVYGYIMNPNTSETIENIALGYENHYVIAATDNACSDADVYLLNSNNGEISKDTSTDATPVIKAQTYSAERYKVKLRNVSSSGKSLVMMAILTS